MCFNLRQSNNINKDIIQLLFRNQKSISRHVLKFFIQFIKLGWAKTGLTSINFDKARYLHKK